MSNVIEHLFCGYCKQECSGFGDQRNFCTWCTDSWNQVESMSDGALSFALLEAHNELQAIHDEPYIGPLNQQDQEYYDCLLFWFQILEEEEVYRDEERAEYEMENADLCENCREDYGYSSMENLCADCYWEEDSRRKHERRIDPKWRFERIFSFAHVVEGKNEEEAFNLAVSVFQKEGLPLPTQ